MINDSPSTVYCYILAMPGPASILFWAEEVDGSWRSKWINSENSCLQCIRQFRLPAARWSTSGILLTLGKKLSHRLSFLISVFRNVFLSWFSLFIRNMRTLALETATYSWVGEGTGSLTCFLFLIDPGTMCVGGERADAVAQRVVGLQSSLVWKHLFSPF